MKLLVPLVCPGKEIKYWASLFLDNNWEDPSIVGFSWSSKALTRSILLNASGRIHCANGKIHELVFTLVLHWVVLLSYITYLKNSSKDSTQNCVYYLLLIKSYFNTVVTFLWNTVQELVLKIVWNSTILVTRVQLVFL